MAETAGDVTFAALGSSVSELGDHDMNTSQETASAPDIRNATGESLGSDVSGNELGDHDMTRAQEAASAPDTPDIRNATDESLGSDVSGNELGDHDMNRAQEAASAPDTPDIRNATDESLGSDVSGNELGDHDMNRAQEAASAPDTPDIRNATDESLGSDVSGAELGDHDMNRAQEAASAPDTPDIRNATDESLGSDVSGNELGEHDMSTAQEAASAPDIRNALDESLRSDVSGNKLGDHNMNTAEEAASATDIRNATDESLGSDVSGNVTLQEPYSNEPPFVGRETDDSEIASMIEGRDDNEETHALDQDVFISASADEDENKLQSKEGAIAAEKENEKEMLEFVASIGDSEAADDVRVQQILERAAAVLAEGPLHEDKFVSSECDSTVLLENCLARENGMAEGEIVITEISQEVIEEESAEAEKRAGSEESDGRRDWKSLAANQMVQLSSQLSLLQKQVVELELHDKAKGGFDGLPPLADKEELYKQVSMFAVEVRGLRQNIEEIQHILHREGGDLSEVEHWARDLQSKCADQSAHLEHLGKQVSALSRDLKGHLEFRDDIDGKLEERAHDVQKAEDHLADLSKVLARTSSTIEREDAEIVAQHKDLLLEQLREAEKLRNIAEVKVGTLNKQIEQMQLVCEVAQSIQLVSKHQNKAVKYGLQTLFQFFLLVLGVITLYSRFAQPLRGSIIPT